MSDERVLSALRALAESDRELEVPLELEARVVSAFRRRRRIRTWRGLVIGMAAAVVLAVVWLGGRTGKNAGSQAVLSVPHPVTVQAGTQPVAGTHVVIEALPVPKKGRVRQEYPREVVTDFFPLMDVAPPFESGELLRVNLAAGAMRVVGLPVDEDHLTDRIQADVLVGQEGLPRAIRFVKTIQ
jgi:hypothetical protein